MRARPRGPRRGGARRAGPPALLLLGALAAASACGNGDAGPGVPGTSAGAFRHDLLDGLLARHVRLGMVDYAALRADPDLPAYLALLAAAPAPPPSAGVEAVAFWINAYNAATLKAVADRWPIASIRDVGVQGRLTFFRGISHRIAGKDYTLDTIEHRVLRARYREPRIHFALVCASKGCPRLRSSAYHAATLGAELDEAARAFVADPAKVRWSPGERVLHLSPIFDWYKEDFERAAGSVVAYVRRYLPAEEAALLPPGEVAVRWLDYDWSLNDASAP